MIIKDLFTNFAVLFSLLYLYVHLTKDRHLRIDSSLNRKMIVGLLGGLLGNLLMLYSIHIGDTIIDLRHIPLILLAFFGGGIPAFIAMIVVIVGRFLVGVNVSAFASIPIMLIITGGAVFLSKNTFPKKMKIFLILTWSNVTFTVFITYLLKDLNILLILLPAYWSISYVGGFITFYVIKTLRSSQILFNKYKYESTIDGLTGLNNYRKFDDIFNNLIRISETKNEQLSLLYIDIDFFKKINDKYGHPEGDKVLVQLATILKECTRSFDIVSRNGGEEFTVLLLDCSLVKANEIAESIRARVENQSFQLTKQNVHVTVSIGISSFQETTKDANQLIDDADKALYEAKKTGRNKVCLALYR